MSESAAATTELKMTPQAIFLQNESWLRTVVRSRIPEQDGVEDVMQNIALALVRQREALGDVGKLGAWLYQIAVRQILMYRRTTGRRRNFRKRLAETAERSAAEPAVEPDPSAAVIAAEQAETVRRGLSELDELDRQILMLKYTEGWTYRDLAEHLGVTTDTVEYRLLKARKNLRRILADRVEQ